jgi:hypothetical protein
MSNQVSNRILTESNLISLFLKDKAIEELSKFDADRAYCLYCIVNYRIMFNEDSDINGVMFTANMELWDDDIEEYLPYTSQWLLDVRQVLEWATNQDIFDSYRVKR